MSEQAPNSADYRPRKIVRRVSPWLHKEGHHASNFLGDVLDMQRSPGPSLTIPDGDLLEGAMRTIVPDPDAPDGLAVVMTADELASFLRIRAAYLGSVHAHRKLSRTVLGGRLRSMAIPQEPVPTPSETVAGHEA